MIPKIISHMNAYHKQDIIALARKFGNIQKCEEIDLVDIDKKGLDISCDGQKIRIDFAKEAAESEVKNAIIELYTSLSKTTNYDEIKQEVLSFRDSFDSVVIASIDSNNQAIASYAPLLRLQDRFFIYISEVAEHYSSIKANPNSIEILFLEDEASAKSVILRKRLRYKTRAIFKEKDALFDQIFDCFEKKHKSTGELKSIRKMEDFHLIELIFQEGRFVKGFGSTYDVDKKGNIRFAAESSGNPHKLPHK